MQLRTTLISVLRKAVNSLVIIYLTGRVGGGRWSMVKRQGLLKLGVCFAGSTGDGVGWPAKSLRRQ